MRSRQLLSLRKLLSRTSAAQGACRAVPDLSDSSQEPGLSHVFVPAGSQSASDCLQLPGQLTQVAPPLHAAAARQQAVDLRGREAEERESARCSTLLSLACEQPAHLRRGAQRRSPCRGMAARQPRARGRPWAGCAAPCAGTRAGHASAVNHRGQLRPQLGRHQGSSSGGGGASGASGSVLWR